MTTSYIISDSSVTILHKGKVYTATSAVPSFSDIREAVKAGDFEKATDLINLLKTVTAYVGPTKAGDRLQVTDKTITWDGKSLHGAIVDRILRMMQEGFDIAPMKAFLANLMENPSYRSREQLYTFLERNQLPITPDGCFMAYKRIKGDWTDVYTGSNLHRVGATISMPRVEVDDDPNRTCSAGLHVASLPYLAHFSGERLIAVKINPKNVVSVPTDYDFSKMRVCEYTVVEELPMSVVEEYKDYWGKSVAYDEDEEDAYEEEEYEEEESDYSDYC